MMKEQLEAIRKSALEAIERDANEQRLLADRPPHFGNL